MAAQLLKEGTLPYAVGALHYQEWWPLIEAALYPVQKIESPIEMGSFNHRSIYHIRVGKRDSFAQEALPL